MTEVMSISTSREVCERLLQGLLYERGAINSAYDSLLKLVQKETNNNNNENENIKENININAAGIINGLAGLLRYMVERLYHHTSEVSLTFAHEMGAFANKNCSEAITALREALAIKLRVKYSQKREKTQRDVIISTNKEKRKTNIRPLRHIFAVSSHFDWETQREIMELITRGLNRTAVILRRCRDDNNNNNNNNSSEDNVALLLGCHVLISPQFPNNSPCAVAYLTREQLLQYVQSRLGNIGNNWKLSQTSLLYNDEIDGDGVDDELDALLQALDTRERECTTLTEISSPNSSINNISTVVTRDVLRGVSNTPNSRISTDNINNNNNNMDVISWHNETEDNNNPTTQATRRQRIEPLMSFPLSPESLTNSEQFSQVIQYRRDSPTRGTSTPLVDNVDETILDPTNWCFQISLSLKDSKSEIIKAIKRLGGRVDNSSAYSPQTTHLVVAEGLAERTEKYLSCCAALKFIIPPRYIFDSVKRGKWLVGRLHEYDRNPLRHRLRLSSSSSFSFSCLPFTGWRVILFTSATFVNAGVVAVLQAGGCSDITSLIFDNTNTLPELNMTNIENSSHLLVECREVSSAGCFLLPPWFPSELKRSDPRFFSLELLHHLLCFSTFPIFDEKGKLIDEEQLPPSCRVEMI